MSPSTAQTLRREAEKARRLAAGAYGEYDRQRLAEVADMLEREAAAIERALSGKRPEEPPPGSTIAPPLRENP